MATTRFILGNFKLTNLRPIDDVSRNQETAPAKDNRKGQGWHQSSSGGSRNIEVKQNWLTRLFRVKPATSCICMTLSRQSALLKVTKQLLKWSKYGITDVQVDKERSIVFARVGAENCELPRMLTFISSSQS